MSDTTPPDSSHADHFVPGPDGAPIATPVGGCAECSTLAVRDHAEAESLHRDDLARDVAREWTQATHAWGPPVSTLREVYPALTAALDRLAAAYGEKPNGKED